MIELTSTEYDCWHEAGHAIVCLFLGGRVEFIEILDGDDAPGRARARCNFSPDDRKHIACGGFSAEYFLYRSKRIDVTEKEFVQNALVNASRDKESFFGRDFEQANGCWPKEMDSEFMKFSIANVVPIINGLSATVEEIVRLLLRDGRIEEDQLNDVVRKNGGGVKR